MKIESLFNIVIQWSTWQERCLAIQKQFCMSNEQEWTRLLIIICTMGNLIESNSALFKACLYRTILTIRFTGQIYCYFLWLGTIHLRRRHILGGEGSKIGQICRRIVVKNCRRRGGRGQKSWKFADVLNEWSLTWQIKNLFFVTPIPPGKNTYCRYHSRFCVQVWHETKYAYSGNNQFLAISCYH